MSGSERQLVRDLARQYLEACAAPVQEERRRLWRAHNSLKQTRPPIYTRAFAWGEMPQARCQCQDGLLRHYESFFRQRLFWNSLGDDSIFEPWVTVRASHRCSDWGVPVERHRSGVERGSWKIDYPIRAPEDLARLQPARHEIDEEATAERVARVRDLLGDLIEVDVDRSPAFTVWGADISTHLGYLRGIEHFMLDMMDRPGWLKEMVGFMSAGIRRAHKQAEQAGDWGLSAHQNQAMPYAEELEDPAANTGGVKRRQLWCFMAAQEFTATSPAQHDEFLLQYQLPILREFGLTAYGCCEDLTHKIDMVRQIPNLRRIAVSPMADVAACAEQIGRDYVFSYRPSPTDMVGYGLDRDRVAGLLRADLQACRECIVDITLKDVETVEGDENRVREWVRITRQVIDEVFE